MVRKVLLTISGLQEALDAEPQSEIMVCGRYYKRGYKHFVFYRDPEDDSDDDDITGAHMIRIGTDSVEVLRKGVDHMHIQFEAGEGSAAVYHTMAGDLLLNIYTYAIEVTETPEAISTRLHYSLTMNEVFISDCEVTIEMRFLPDGEENFT